MRTLLIIAAIAALLFACGKSPETDDNQDDNNQTENGDPEWEEYSLQHGWLQLNDDRLTDVDDGIGSWIETGDEDLPDTCSGDLEAGTDSEGLAAVKPGEEHDPDNQQNIGTNSDNTGSNSNSGSNGGDIFTPDTSELSPRPGIDDHTPLHLARLGGEMRPFPEHDLFSRLIAVAERRHGDPIRVNTCRTAFSHGHCYIPGDSFNDVCAAAINRGANDRTNVVDIEDDDGDWTITLRVERHCEHGNDLSDDHPDDVELVGHHILTISDAADLPEGEFIELSDDELRWEGSYREHTSDEVMNPGGVSCTWDWHEVSSTARATARIDDNTLFLDLRGDNGDDADFLVWGNFNIL